MRWLVRKVFGAETREAEQVEVSNLYSWFEEQEQTHYEKLLKNIDAYRKILAHQASELAEAADQLAGAPQTDGEGQFSAQRYKDLVKRQITELSESMSLPHDVHELFSAVAYLEKKMEEILDSRYMPSLKGAYPEAVYIAEQTLRESKNTLREVRDELNTYRVSSIEPAKRKITELQEMAHEVQSGIQSRKEKKERLTSLQEEKKELEDRRKNLKSQKGYQQVEVLYKRLQKVEKKIEELQEELLSQFRTLKPTLERFQEIAFENRELVRGYIRDPIHTLRGDRKLRILRILQNVKRRMEAGELQVKDPEVRKVIVSMDATRLQDFLGRYNRLLKEYEAEKARLQKHTLASKLHALDEKIAEHERRIHTLKDELKPAQEGKTDTVWQRATQIQHEIQRIFNRRIHITGLPRQ